MIIYGTERVAFRFLQESYIISGTERNDCVPDFTRINDTSKTAQIMNGDIIITLAALCHCQRASKVISPFIIFAVFDVSFRRYKL